MKTFLTVTFTLLAILVLLSYPIQIIAQEPDSELEANKEVVRSYIESWEQADLTTLDELLAEEFVNHSPPLPHDREGMMAFATEHRNQFPTGEYTIQNLVAEDDLVFVYGHYQGTHDGEPFMGIPARGAEASFDYSILLRLEDGQIAERWGTADDVMGLLVPLGFELVPPEAGLDEAMVAKIEAAIEDTMQEFQIPGCAIGVVQDGQTVYDKGFGVVEIETDQPVTAQSLFHLASISKTATTTGIMQLVAQGKIDLDALVTDYLPYFALEDELAQNITIRQLLSHTAGVPDVVDWMADFESPEFDDEALERQVRGLSGRALLFDPGEGWDYSSAGFNVLGDVIAKVSGQSYEDYVQENIFTPLGMTHTSSLLNEVDPDMLTSPHIIDETGQMSVNEVFPYSRAHGPSNNLYSNIDDMIRYAMAHLNRGELDGVRILPEAAYDEMWTVEAETWFPLELQHNYGLGWMIGERGQHQVVGHGGLDFGYNAYLGLVPDQSIGFLLTCNYAEFGEEVVFPAFIAADPIVDALLNIEEVTTADTAEPEASLDEAMLAVQKTVTEFEAIDVACADGNIVLTEEPLMAGRSELEFSQEPDEIFFQGTVTFFPDAYPDATWVAPGEGLDTPDGGFFVIHRAYGTGALEGNEILFTATSAEEQEDLPCEPAGPVAKLEGVIIYSEEVADLAMVRDITVSEFESIDVTCVDGEVMNLTDEPILIGPFEIIDAIQEDGEQYFQATVVTSPTAYPDSSWVAPGQGFYRPDGSFIAFHRGYGTGDLKGIQIVYVVEPVEGLEDLPCEPDGPVIKSEGFIILPKDVE